MKNKKIRKSKSCRARTLFVSAALLAFFVSIPNEGYAKNETHERENVTEIAQKQTISGVVKDSQGEPLIGVSVIVKGTKQGTVTDLDGAFTIDTTEPNSILVFSYIGYKPQEINVGGKKNITVVMIEDAETLDDVVVVGYGVQKKKLVTGATVQVDGGNLAKMSTSSALGALQSQAPGVNITQKSGMPGEGYKVTVRGLGTVGDSNPLYVIDGIAGGDINTLNPSEIESIDILKDAASAAIYGARAANGVILVTTKQGKTGKMQISYDGYIGWQNVYKMPSLLDAKDYMTIVNESRFNEGTPLLDFSKELPQALYNSIMDGSWKGTNWMEEIRNKNAITQNHSINLIGGNEQSKFSLGFSYSEEDGILGKPTQPNNSRYTFRVNSDHVLLKSNNLEVIKIGENVSYSFNQKSGIGISTIYTNDIHNMLVGNPLMPVYNSNGGYYDQPTKEAEGWLLQGTAANPIAEMDYSRGQNLTKRYGLRANAYLEIQPINKLKYRSVFGYKFSAASFRQYRPVYELSTTVINSNDDVEQNQEMGHSWTLENTLSYSFKIKDIHSFDAVIGQSLEKWGLGENLRAVNSNSLFPGMFSHAWIGNTQGISSANTLIDGLPFGEGSLASFFGRVNYNLKETYLASVIMRADGSSNFAKGHRWGYFPSVSAGWVISNEPWMQDVSNWLYFLKFRGSWGRNGNSNIDNFQYLATIAFDNKNGYYFGNNKDDLINGAYPDILANPDITWETSEQLDFGVDARFLNSRLGLTFDWYKKTTKDWLVRAPILSSYGTNAPYINGGDVENKGFEIGLTWNDNIKDFAYGASFNLSTNKNKVTRIANSEGIIHGPENVLSQGTKEMYRAQVGYPIGYFWGYKTNGVFQNQEQINNTRAKLEGAQPGDLIFADTNNDGVINDDDKVKIGDPHPDVTIGFGINLAYRGFDLSLTANGAFGQQIAKSYRSFADSPLQNYTADIFGRWYGEGTSNKLPRLTSGSNPNWQNISDIYIENGDYVKLQNITIGYDLKRLFPKIPMTQARFYVTAQNLFTITKYSGMDPEIGYGGGDSWASGIDLGFYPSPRTILIGFNIKY